MEEFISSVSTCTANIDAALFPVFTLGGTATAASDSYSIINTYLLASCSVSVSTCNSPKINEISFISCTIEAQSSCETKKLYKDYISSTARAITDASVFTLVPIVLVPSSPAYPDVITDIPGVIPFQWQYEQRVLVSQFADGSESRRLSWQSNKKTVLITYRYLERADASEIYEFFRQRDGSLGDFSFFFPNNLTYTKEYCGTYTGQTTTINLPSLSDEGSSLRNLYANGNLLTEGTAYVFTRGGGHDGSDSAQLLFTPNLGTKFHWSFYGRLRIKARFSESPVQVNEIKDRFASLSVELVGLEAEFI